VTTQPVGQDDLAWFSEQFQTVSANIELVIQGKREVIELIVMALLSEGHVLVEDVPGVGKTLLAKSLSRSIHCDFQRIQFTPDLLPSDITGVSVWDRERGAFVFRAGPILPISSSGTRSTAPAPRPKPPCWRQWKSVK